jgi:hypothetical protein
MRVLILEDLLESGPGASLWLLAVFFLNLLGERVHVAEDKVQLGVAATLVRTKHNGVGGLERKEVLQKIHGILLSIIKK